MCFVKHVFQCLFSNGRFSYRRSQTERHWLDYWPGRDRDRGSRTKCNAWPSIDGSQTPCLSVEGIGPVLDHSPCIDQSKWNDLSGTQWPDLM